MERLLLLSPASPFFDWWGVLRSSSKNSTLGAAQKRKKQQEQETPSPKKTGKNNSICDGELQFPAHHMPLYIGPEQAGQRVGPTTLCRRSTPLFHPVSTPCDI